MRITCLLGESRCELADRLDAADTLTRWACAEPSLGCVSSVSELFRALQPDSEPSRWDTLLGALLRLAAADGGGDDNAVLVVLHVVDRGADRLCRRGFDPGLILGELTIQIRTFPWRTRTRAFAANLLLDTEHALCREVNPARMRTRRRAIPALDLFGDPSPRDEVNADPGSDDLDLVDLLLWAERTGILAARDLSMLVEYYYAREFTGAGHEHVAQVYGVNVRTSKRRCTAALQALRAAVPQYLAS